MKKSEFFKLEGNRINRIRRHCPKCGPGVFLADHKNRFSCGKCGYTEFKGGSKRQSEKPPEIKKEFKDNKIKEDKSTDQETEKEPLKQENIEEVEQEEKPTDDKKETETEPKKEESEEETKKSD